LLLVLRVSPLMGFKKKKTFRGDTFWIQTFQSSPMTNVPFLYKTLYSSVFPVWQQELTHKCPRPLVVTPLASSVEELGKRQISLTTCVLYTRFQLYRFIQLKSSDVCAYKMCPFTFIYTKRITKNDSQYETLHRWYEFWSIIPVIS